MRDTECYPVEALGEVAALAAGHARLAHLALCPRCRARLAEYRCFMAAEAPAGSDVEDADRRLGALLRRPRPALAAPARTAAPIRPARRALRPALALAAVLAAALGLWRVTGGGGPAPDGGRLLRGAGPEAAGAPAPLSVLALPDGRLRLSWRAVEDADAYTVALHAPDLTELVRLPAGTATSLEVDPAALRAVGPEGGARHWLVVASRGGDEIARSPLRPLADGP